MAQETSGIGKEETHPGSSYDAVFPERTAASAGPGWAARGSVGWIPLCGSGNAGFERAHRSTPRSRERGFVGRLHRRAAAFGPIPRQIFAHGPLWLGRLAARIPRLLLEGAVPEVPAGSARAGSRHNFTAGELHNQAVAGRRCGTAPDRRRTPEIRVGVYLRRQVRVLDRGR